jgi:FMN phosphatase YigB (HAD superfamily)
MTKSNFNSPLIAFDAFVTLFSPKKPIAAQYCAVTRQYLTDKLGDIGAKVPLNEDNIHKSFINALKQQSANYPNYGQTVKMKPETWWSHVVKTTIFPSLKAANIDESQVFPGLSDVLIHHFSSDAAYALHSDARHVLQTIQTLKTYDTGVGIISNSDHRLISILKSLGLRLPGQNESISPQQDFNFLFLSYDTAKPKPASDMFHLAEEFYLSRFNRHPGTKLYIGDDFRKDAMAATKAGWNCILVDRDNTQGHHFDSSNITKFNGATVERVSSLWPMSSSLWPWDSRVLEKAASNS